MALNSGGIPENADPDSLNSPNNLQGEAAPDQEEGTSPDDLSEDAIPEQEEGICEGEKRPPPSAEAVAMYKMMIALAGSRTLPDEKVQALNENGELERHVPLDDDGQQTSFGSIMHWQEPVGTECRPCVFWIRGRCKKNELCIHCHIKHPDLKGKSKRLRASRSTRLRRAKAAKMSAEASEDLSTEQNPVSPGDVVVKPDLTPPPSKQASTPKGRISQPKGGSPIVIAPPHTAAKPCPTIPPCVIPPPQPPPPSTTVMPTVPPKIETGRSAARAAPAAVAVKPPPGLEAFVPVKVPVGIEQSQPPQVPTGNPYHPFSKSAKQALSSSSSWRPVSQTPPYIPQCVPQHSHHDPMKLPLKMMSQHESWPEEVRFAGRTHDLSMLSDNVMAISQSVQSCSQNANLLQDSRGEALAALESQIRYLGNSFPCSPPVAESVPRDSSLSFNSVGNQNSRPGQSTAAKVFPKRVDPNFQLVRPHWDQSHLEESYSRSVSTSTVEFVPQIVDPVQIPGGQPMAHEAALQNDSADVGIEALKEQLQALSIKVRVLSDSILPGGAKNPALGSSVSE